MALALCLALSFSNYSNSQDISATGNLVSQAAWDGCATYLQSRTWGGYSGGPCPNVGLDGTGVTFSYGQTTLAQTIAINRALQDTGVQVNGYNYSWMVKNSNINGQQGGSFDPIALVNVQVKDTKGAVLVNDTYNYGYHLPNWQTFSGTQTFTSPYVANTLASVGLSVTSKDSGYWAGYYGPEFRNFNLSLNYGAAAVVTPTATPTAPKTTTYTSAATTSPTTVDTSSVPTTAVSVGGVQLSTTGEIAAPDNIPQVLKDSVATVAAVVVATTSAATSTDAVKTESNKSGPSATVMNAVKQIQAADKAVQTRAVQNANQQIAASSSRAQEQAMAIVDTATAMSATSSQGGSQTSSQSGTVSIMQAPQQQQTSSQSSQSSSQSAFQLSFAAPQIIQQTIQSQAQVQSSVDTSVQTSSPVGVPMLTAKISSMFNTTNEASINQSDVTVSGQSVYISRTSITNEPIDFKLLMDTNINDTKTDSVNRNVQINDLAGGVDITAMATQPKGYEVYSLLTMKDAGFYAPKDIYGNQTNVDNARALRQLGSDRLHRAMVDSQYKLGE